MVRTRVHGVDTTKKGFESFSLERAFVPTSFYLESSVQDELNIKQPM